MLRAAAKRRTIPARGRALAALALLCLSGWCLVAGLCRWLPAGSQSKNLLGLGLASRSAAWQSSTGKGALIALAGFDLHYLPGVLERGLPAARASTVQPANSDHLNSESEAAPVQAAATTGCQVAIYHTHNAETYIPTDGAGKVEGKNGGVALVGNKVAKVLTTRGITVVHDLTIHDYPDFPTSYIHSAVTAARLVKENPDLKVLMDLHRDAGQTRKETVQVNGRTVARVMLIVGHSELLPNAHWRENYAFALTIAHRMDEMYPGVLKAVRVQNGRFNQNLSPHAILVEVGSDRNTLAEAQGAGRCLGEVLADLIKNQ